MRRSHIHIKTAEDNFCKIDKDVAMSCQLWRYVTVTGSVSHSVLPKITLRGSSKTDLCGRVTVALIVFISLNHFGNCPLRLHPFGLLPISSNSTARI